MSIFDITKYNHANDINRLTTTKDKDFARLAVDVGQTGLFMGREFRYIRKLSLTGALWWKFSSPVDFMIIGQSLSVAEGEFEFRAYRTLDVTDNGGWGAAPVPSFGKNTSTERPLPYYIQQSSILSGGSVTLVNADNYADFAILKAANANGQRATVIGDNNSARYLAAGTYYLQFLPISGSATGSISLIFEERP